MPTKISCAASEYSSDRSEWYALPAGLTSVTGQMSRNACALVFDQLALSEAAVIDRDLSATVRDSVGSCLID